MNVPLFDYRAQLEEMRGEVDAAIDEVLRGGQLILGPAVQRFEREFAAYLGGGECVGVNSGTDAIAIALWAYGVRPGDEVITVANTAVPTVSAIRMTGAVPVFVDVDPETSLIDLDAVARAITARTRAIVPVHLYGNAVDVDALLALVRGRPIHVLEDCAQSTGATWRGRMTGTIAPLSTFSFYPTKNLGAYGDGGLCWTAEPGLAAAMRQLRMYGFEGRYYAEREGINSRLDELQAAILSVKLKRLPRWVEQRRTLAAQYDRQLAAGVGRVREADGARHAYHLYVVQVADRDAVRQQLAAAGITTGIHYPFPIHTMRAYEFLGYRRGSLPVTEALAERILTLPLYPELGEAQVSHVATTLNGLVPRR